MTSKDQVGFLVLNRPRALNTFNLEMAETFLDGLGGFSADPAIKTIVIKSNGSVFSAGGDVREMLGYVEDGEDRAAYFRAPLTAFGQMVIGIREIPKPVIAAVHGAVAGFAFNLVLACDFIIAAADTRFSQSFIKVGLSPDAGGTFFLPQLLGLQRASELAMLPVEIDAEKACNWGLINRVYPADQLDVKVEELCETLALAPSEAIAKTKMLLNQACLKGLQSHIESERLAQVENAAHFNFEEGLRAFIEKREPRFNQK